MGLMDSDVQLMSNKKIENMPAILFVCLGNICRSPAAEGVFRHLIHKAGKEEDCYIDSCGIGDWHVGALPDFRMQKAAQNRGVVLTGRARQFLWEDFKIFDHILAVDHEVLNDLHRQTKTIEEKAKIHLLTDFSISYKGQDVPDPFYKGEAAFELVLDILEESCEGLFNFLFQNAGSE